MSRTNIIEACESWIRNIESLNDLEFQKKYWFDYDGPLISSFDEATEHFVRIYEIRLNPKFERYCNQECQNFLAELYQKVNKYRWDEKRILEYDPEIALLEDPKWLEIVALTKKTIQALKDNIEAVKSEE